MNPEVSTLDEKERESASQALTAMAKMLDDILNGKGTPRKERIWGFALLVFPLDRIDQNHINYIGNGERNDVLTAIKELASRWEGRTEHAKGGNGSDEGGRA